MANGIAAIVLIVILMAPIVAGGVYAQLAIGRWQRGALSARAMLARSFIAVALGTVVPMALVVLILAPGWTPGVFLVAGLGLLSGGVEYVFLTRWHDPRQWGGRLRRELVEQSQSDSVQGQ